MSVLKHYGIRLEIDTWTGISFSRLKKPFQKEKENECRADWVEVIGSTLRNTNFTLSFCNQRFQWRIQTFR